MGLKAQFIFPLIREFVPPPQIQISMVVHALNMKPSEQKHWCTSSIFANLLPTTGENCVFVAIDPTLLMAISNNGSPGKGEAQARIKGRVLATCLFHCAFGYK